MVETLKTSNLSYLHFYTECGIRKIIPWFIGLIYYHMQTAEQRDELAREMQFLKTRIDSLKKDVADLVVSKDSLEGELIKKRQELDSLVNSELVRVKQIFSLVKDSVQ